MMRIERSLLFVPGDRPERFAKAAATEAHEVIIDLEDAVAAENKAGTREATRDWIASGGVATVRINGMQSPWFDDDLAMLRELPDTRVMLPKAEPESVHRFVSELGGRPLIALIETVRGVMELRDLTAAQGLERLAFGSVDFSVESGISDVGDALTSVRTRIVLESCYAGLLPPVDGVSLELNDPQLMQSEAQRTRQLGFGGKLCIHPRQVASVNAAFLPTEQDVAWAKRVISAVEKSGGGATQVDGEMVDKPVLERARRFLSAWQHGEQ
jgi:citrate lyase subunit beta/citryl-CoA lyase